MVKKSIKKNKVRKSTKKKSKKSNEKNRTIMISGPMTLTKYEFDKYYSGEVIELDKNKEIVKDKPKLKDFLNKNKIFIVGGADGSDIFTIQYLLEKNQNIIICIPKNEFDEPSDNLKPILNSNNKNIKIVHHFENLYKTINGEKKKIKSKFEIRDEYMTKNSYMDIARLHQYGGGTSASAKNILRRKFGSKKADDVIKLLRDHGMIYIKELDEGTYEVAK